MNPKCSNCQGIPKIKGWIFSNAHHICDKCGGTGQQLRPGRKQFFGQPRGAQAHTRAEAATQRTPTLDLPEHLFDTMGLDREPVEYPPDKWRGELEGLYIKHDGDIPVTVKVTWTDGTEGEINAWTGQWTRTHVCVCRESAPPYHPFWVRAFDVRRREN